MGETAMSDTPRTDVIKFANFVYNKRIFDNWEAICEKPTEASKIIGDAPIDVLEFARQLERELAAANQKCSQLTLSNTGTWDAVRKVLPAPKQITRVEEGLSTR
jgi:hypothetical protein